MCVLTPMQSTPLKQVNRGCSHISRCRRQVHGIYSQSRCRMQRMRAEDSLQQAAVAGVFEPHIDGSVVAAQAVVVGLTIGVAAYWWYAVVPSARRTLAKEKRAGSVRDYLLELQNNSGRKLERWFYTDWLRQLQSAQKMGAQHRTHDANSAEGKDTISQKQQQSDDKQPYFWSLDNPILATAAIIGTVVLASTFIQGPS